jgi:hypothetical protein
MLLQERDHFTERLAACDLRGFHIHELADDVESLLGRIFAQQHLLCGDGISLALLIL